MIQDRPGADNRLAHLIRSAGFGCVSLPASEDFFRHDLSRSHCFVVEVTEGAESGLDMISRLGQHGLRTPVIALAGEGRVLDRLLGSRCAQTCLLRSSPDRILRRAIEAAVFPAARGWMAGLRTVWRERFDQPQAA